jgi:hypothetical protein
MFTTPFTKKVQKWQPQAGSNTMLEMLMLFAGTKLGGWTLQPTQSGRHDAS